MTSEEGTIRASEAGEAAEAAALVRREILSTFGPRVLKLSGPFAGLFRLDYDEKIFQRNYRNPVLVAASNDAPAERAELAVRTGRLGELASDVAALCMNDVLMVGAEPLFLLHHVSGDVSADGQGQIVEGLAGSCRQAGCALMSSSRIEAVSGGGVLSLAAFVVGVVDHRRMITGEQIDPDDEVIGIAGTGLHGPAYRMVRDALLGEGGLDVNARVEGLEVPVVEELLRPATSYAGVVPRILRYYRRKRVIGGIVHVREGRLAEDIAKILPEGRRVRIDPKAWPVPTVCELLRQVGMPEKTLWPWAGAGIGLVMIVRPAFTQSILKQLQRRGLGCWRIGVVSRGERGVEIS